MWRRLFCTLSSCLASRKAGIAQKRMKAVEMINDSFPSLAILRSSSRVEYILIVICRKYERLFNRQWGHTGLINNAREWRLFASLTNGTFWEQSKINQRQVTTRGGREGIRGKTNWSFVDLGNALGSWSLFHEDIDYWNFVFWRHFKDWVIESLDYRLELVPRSFDDVLKTIKDRGRN